VQTAKDFKIGDLFRAPHGKEFRLYRVTDIGSRVLVAIWVNSRYKRTPEFFKGPPYKLPEVCFDEDDLKVIEKYNGVTDPVDPNNTYPLDRQD